MFNRFTDIVIHRILSKHKYIIGGMILGIILFYSGVAGQGTGSPNTLRVLTDANNYLVVSSAASTLPLSSPTVFSNTRIRTDATGALVITDGSSGVGFAPNNATYITRTASSGLSAEQALSTLSTGLMNVTTTTGVITSIADVAAGQVLTSGTPSAWSATPSVTSLTTSAANTFNATNLAAGPATDGSTGTKLINVTNATVGTVAQWSPPLQFKGSAWDTDDAVVRNTDCYITVRPISGTTVSSQFQFMCQIAAGGYTNAVLVTNTGQMNISNSLGIGASSSIVFSGRTGISSDSNGLIRFNQNSGSATTGVEINAGTAVPTVANCSVGSTGTISTSSSNTSGEVNTGSGSTSCDVVFGAPAFTKAPFCTITDETSVILAPRISARSTTGFTVTGLTAGDKFLYICIGGLP
jgi:hypothetical protein